ALGARSLALRAFYEVQRSSTALGLVAEGVAAAVVPSLAIQRGTYPTLRVIALTDPVVSRTLVLLSRRNAHLSPAAQALYDVISHHAGGHDAAGGQCRRPPNAESPRRPTHDSVEKRRR